MDKKYSKDTTFYSTAETMAPSVPQDVYAASGETRLFPIEGRIGEKSWNAREGRVDQRFIGVLDSAIELS
jgi:hypothetical protein